jgi:hypothetical protein
MYQSGEANRALSSAPDEREMGDLGALFAGLSAYRPHPEVHLPKGRKSLWKSCDSESLDMEH